MLLASNHMFPTGPIETVFERLARAGAGGLDLFLPHVPYLLDTRFGPNNLALCRDAAATAGLPIESIIAAPLQGNAGFTAHLGPDPEKGRAESIAFVRHNVELAAALGASHFSAAEGRLPDGADEPEMWGRLVHMLRGAAAL